MTNTNLPDHWTPAELVGAPAYLQRAAKDYAEAYALAALAQSGQGEVVATAWAVYDSQGFYELHVCENTAAKWCDKYNARDVDPLKPYTYRKCQLFEPHPQPAQPSEPIGWAVFAPDGEWTPYGSENAAKQGAERMNAHDSGYSYGPVFGAAQPARVVGTVTGYQTASGAQQWQFNPSNVAGLENQRFDVALSTPTAAPTPGSITSMQHPMNPGGFQDCGFGPTWHDYAAAPAPSQQAAVTELVDSLSNVEKEYELLAAMRNIELRRPRRSFGIRVMSDELAVEWQVLDKRLDGLIDARRRTLSAYAKKEGA